MTEINSLHTTMYSPCIRHPFMAELEFINMQHYHALCEIFRIVDN